MKYIIYILAISCTISCANKKKATRYFNENPKELAELCKLRFPISEKYIPGDTIIKLDTLRITEKEPVFINCPDGSKKECPPKETKYITRIETIRDTIVKIDTRETAILKEDLTKTFIKFNQAQAWKHRFLLLSLILFVIIVIQRFLK